MKETKFPKHLRKKKNLQENPQLFKTKKKKRREKKIKIALFLFLSQAVL